MRDKFHIWLRKDDRLTNYCGEHEAMIHVRASMALTMDPVHLCSLCLTKLREESLAESEPIPNIH